MTDGVDVAMKELRKKHKRDQTEQSLKRQTRMEIQKLQTEFAKKKKEIRKNTDKAQLQEALQAHDMKLSLEIERLRFELAEKLDQMRKDRDQPPKEEVVYTQQDELAETKGQLKAMKKEYQASMHDLKQAIKVSEEHLQTNYELISALKEDKRKLVEEAKQLEDRIATHMEQLEKCRAERRKTTDHMVSADLSTKENQHSQAIQVLRDRLEQCRTQVTQCTAAIRQSHEEMDAYKQKHEGLRNEYEDQSNRIQLLTEALEKCKQKNINTNELLQEVTEKYADMKAQMAQQWSRKGFQKEQEQTDAIRASLLSGADDEEKRSRSMESHAFQTLESCNRKCSNCLEQIERQNEYIRKLESEIKRLLKGDGTSGETHTIHSNELTELKGELDRLVHENRLLRKTSEEMVERHMKLKEKHAHAMEWITEMKDHHKKLHQNAKDTAVSIQNVDKTEHQIESCAHQVQSLESEIAKYKEKIKNCLYPGERERLVAQVEDLIRDRNGLKDQESKLISEHAAMTRKIKDLEEQKAELLIVKQRFEMDVAQMQQIVTKTAELNVELVNTQKALEKKEKQMSLLSGQLATMITRVKTLEEREQVLTNKLNQSTGPEETESMMKHLSMCRSEVKQATDRYTALKASTQVMQEELEANKSKVIALVQVIKDSELSQKEWIETKKLGKGTLSTTTTTSLPPLESVDKMTQQHEQMMAESNKRIEDLRNQLYQIEEQRERQGNTVKPEEMPMTKDDRVRVIEQRADQVIRKAKDDLMRATNDPDKVKGAIQAANLESVNDMQRLKMVHNQTMRDKEREIMDMRDDTYNQLLKTVELSNSDPNADPNALYAQIKDIRSQASTREQQAMSDMLRLRAISSRLTAEHQEARRVQAKLLDQANAVQRQKLLESVPPSVVQQNAQVYQSLVGAHRDYITTNSQDVLSRLDQQTQYIRELERQYPKMDSLVRSIDLQRFPKLNELQMYANREKTFTVGAIDFERKEAVGYDRSMSALEQQLKALDASVKSITDMTRRYAQQNSEDNLTNLRSLAQMSPGQIQAELQRQAQIKDKSLVRTQGVVFPRVDGTQPGKIMAADLSTGEIQMRMNPQGPPSRYFHSSVSVFGDPAQTFAPTVERAVAQYEKGLDTIVITYSFELSSSKSPIKFKLFEHALKTMFPRVQQLTRNGELDLQLVQVSAGNTRLDKFASTNANLPVNCSYSTCNAQKITVKDVSSVDKLVDKIREAFTTDNEAENHMILTIGGRIHLTDVLFYPTSDRENPVPTLENIRLLDGSWRNYLIDVLQKPTTKIDLLFGVVPVDESDKDGQLANYRLLQVMDRVQTYLQQIKGTR